MWRHNLLRFFLDACHVLPTIRRRLRCVGLRVEWFIGSFELILATLLLHQIFAGTALLTVAHVAFVYIFVVVKVQIKDVIGVARIFRPELLIVLQEKRNWLSLRLILWACTVLLLTLRQLTELIFVALQSRLQGLGFWLIIRSR